MVTVRTRSITGTAPLLALVLVLTTTCSSRVSGPSGDHARVGVRWPTQGGPTATPESRGLDPRRLAEALEEARKDYVGLHSLLVVRDEAVVLDAYAYPFDRSMLHDLASVTKSVTATLIGIAATQGKLDLDAPMISFFPDREIANLDEDKERITVRHLLSMSSGLECADYPYEVTQRQMRASPDYIQFVLDLAVTNEPGATFSYCSPGMHLLSAILQRATGMSALGFARANLFEPLGIHDVYWPSDPQGVTHGWGDLALRPLDAVKIGYLYLHQGRWDGRRILSREWVAEATSPQAPTGQAEDYGYGWWVSQPGAETRFFRADGNGGQRILVVPSRDLVVVTTGSFSPERLFASLASAAPNDFEPLPADPAGRDRLREIVAEMARGPDPEVIPPLPPSAREISGRTYVFDVNELGVRSVRVDFDDPAEAVLRLDLASEPRTRVDRVGLDGVFRPSLAGRPIVARGAWYGPRTFVIEIDEGPGFHAYDIELRYRDDRVRFEVLGRVFVGSSAN